MVCVRSFVTKEAATLVHNTLILPLFDHCDIAWSNLLQQDMDRLQRLQNRSSSAGTRLREKDKKQGQIGKVSASEASPAIAWGWGKLPRLPLGSLCSPIFFFWPTPIFSFFPNAGLGSRLRSALIISRCTRSSEAMEQLHWPTLSSGRSNHKAKLVFLCRRSFFPSYFSLYFTRFSTFTIIPHGKV